jgi:hypothetical protein
MQRYHCDECFDVAKSAVNLMHSRVKIVLMQFRHAHQFSMDVCELPLKRALTLRLFDIVYQQLALRGSLGHA